MGLLLEYDSLLPGKGLGLK